MPRRALVEVEPVLVLRLRTLAPGRLPDVRIGWEPVRADGTLGVLVDCGDVGGAGVA
jgi:hypothetical protein